MKLKKIYVCKGQVFGKDRYIISTVKKDGYILHLTDDEGLKSAKENEGLFIFFEHLPKPLFQQIRS